MDKPRFRIYKKIELKKSDVATIVDAFCRKKGWTPERFKTDASLPNYGRMAFHAKRILEKCGNNLEDALYMIHVKNWQL